MQLQKARIQITEDETIIALDIKTTLRKLGYLVTSITSSGEEAIKNAGEEKPDLILMDIRLNGKMSGIQAANIINEKFNIPIVYVTGQRDKATLEEINKSQFSCIFKPFNEQILKNILELKLKSN